LRTVAAIFLLIVAWWVTEWEFSSVSPCRQTSGTEYRDHEHNQDECPTFRGSIAIFSSAILQWLDVFAEKHRDGLELLLTFFIAAFTGTLFGGPPISFGRLASARLLIEWPAGEDEPTKYWLSTLPKDISLRRLVDIAKLRWRIERDYQELKQELGLGHFEGRGWRGFHHHATLCIAAYGFLISERETIPPSGPRTTTLFAELAVPNGYRSRGSTAAARASHPKLDRDHASTADRRARQKPAAMPMLQCSNRKTLTAQKFVTQ